MRALRPVGCELQGGNAVLVLRGEADPGFEPERPGDLLREEAPDGAAVHPANELAAQPAEGQRVVAQRCSRIVARLLRLEQLERAGALERLVQA